MSKSLCAALLAATNLFLFSPALFAQEAIKPTPEAIKQDMIVATPPPPTLGNRIRGLFDVELPKLDPPGTYNFQFNPRFSDFINRDYLRVPVGLRWTANSVPLALNAEAEAYFTHGLGNTDNHVAGISTLRFGGKYVFQKWLRPELAATLGFTVSLPVGSPPVDLTDGINHFSPYLIAEHRLHSNPKVTIFGGPAFDLVTPSHVVGEIGTNTPTDDSFTLTAGAVYDLGQIKWTLQTTYTTSASWAHESVNIINVRPSVIWFVPKKYTFHSKTQWILGVGLRGTWGPDGFEFGQSSRVRAELTFHQVMEKLKEVSGATPVK